MDKKEINDLESMNSDKLKLFLLIMFMEDIKQKKSQWESFENELIYKNRFSAKHAIIDEIYECQTRAEMVYKRDTVLYRARIFEKIDFNRLIQYYLREIGYSKPDIEKLFGEWTDEQKILSLISGIYSSNDYNQIPELIKAQKKWRKNIKFKGWSKKDSGAPPADSINNGRANPDHIRYLYLSEDPITPVYEVRPIIGDNVSVAKFKLKKEVRLYDLTLDIGDIGNGETVKLPRLYNTIGTMFSKPYNGDSSKYLPTQYIAEEIKNMGFDGLRFKSSLNNEGYNVVLFNPDDCIAVSSDLVEVKGIELKLDEPIIYKVGTSKLSEELNGLVQK